MEEEVRVEQKPARRRRAGDSGKRYTADEKLKAVRLHLQEGYPLALVSQELGMGKKSLWYWVRTYRQRGEAGLGGKRSPRPGRRLPGPVREKIVELKRRHRWYGVKRIAQTLQRWFLLKASPESVRQTLHQAGLMEKRRRPRRNLTRPRFFERASPNQMWQSDLFTFRLGGKYAYVVAFMDDYSRYVVSLGLYRSPTAEAVIETYRRAVGEYSPPKEMLTDRGRQYTSWRGKSRFAVELQKDRVAHIVSAPQHPMTLGKIERFWATMWQEFLVRAQFDSFEEAQERLRLWTRYYNHRRPHQGIGGMSPADRFFEIQTELKQTLQAGIQENLLELALRGQPKAPFYLVGRMDGQSVVLRAEKGKLKLTVDEKELTYDLKERDAGNGAGEPIAGQTPAALAVLGAHGRREGAGGAGDLDRAGEDRRGDAHAGGAVHDAPAVAAAGDGGDAAGAGAADEPGRRGGALAPAAGAVAAPAGGIGHPEAAGAPEAADKGCRGQPASPALRDARDTLGPASRGADPQGEDGPDDSDGGCGRPGGLAQDLLRMGSAGASGDASGTGAEAAGPSGLGPDARGAGAPLEGRAAAEAPRLDDADRGAACAPALDGDGAR
jgi:transposase InsO family protein